MQKGISALGMAFSIHDLTTRTLGYFVLRNKNHNMVSLRSLIVDRAQISTIIIKRCGTLKADHKSLQFNCIIIIYSLIIC